MRGVVGGRRGLRGGSLWVWEGCRWHGRYWPERATDDLMAEKVPVCVSVGGRGGAKEHPGGTGALSSGVMLYA